MFASTHSGTFFKSQVQRVVHLCVAQLSFLTSLIIVDMIWLLGIAKAMYQDEMGDLMAGEPKLMAGLAFYVLYAIGVCIFVIVPALSKQSWFDAILYGALFGFFCYMNRTHLEFSLVFFPQLKRCEFPSIVSQSAR